jgi:hypothetical protein
MKKITLFAIPLFSLGLTVFGQTQASDTQSSGAPPVPPASAPSTNYSVINRTAHSRLWAVTSWRTNALGRAIPHTTLVTELATGMHVRGSDGQWKEASEQISFVAGGAAVTNTQHQLLFPPDIYTGVIQCTKPDGSIMRSRPLGLSYFDGTNSVLIAELTNSIGQILPSGTQIIYTNCFTDISADLLITSCIGGYECDVVLRSRLPDPDIAFGMDPNRCRVQVLTEFFNTTDPVVKNSLTNAFDGLADAQLNFGAMKMVPGKAFSVGSQPNQNDPGTPVYKSWQHIDNRVFLVEEVPYQRLRTQLSELASAGNQARWFAEASGHAPRFRSSRSDAPRTSLAQQLPPQRPPLEQTALATPPLPPLPPVKSVNTMRLAQSDPAHKPGLKIDYVLVNTAGGDYTFQSDTTYLISSEVYMGTATIEGGSCLKFTNTGVGSIQADYVVCATTPYRMAVLTSMNDGSVGESIPGSTGNPQTFTNSWISYLNGGTNLSHLRFSYASVGASMNDRLDVRNCQFVKCGIGVFNYGGGLYNDLFSACGEAWYEENASTNLPVENVTCDNCTNFLDSLWISTLQIHLTNSLITGISTFTKTLYGTNTPSAVFTNCSTISSSSAGFYQTVGGGAHYLADGSTNRNSGATNIDATLLSDLHQKTTYPPLLTARQILTRGDLNLFPQAQRDTDTPDIGYHYDPLDYEYGWVWTSNALTITVSPGTAIGFFGTNSGNYGLSVGTGGQLISQGTPTALNHFVEYSEVQEQPGVGFEKPSYCLVADSFSGAPAAGIYCRFTDWSSIAQDAPHLYFGGVVPNVQDCRFHGGQLSSLYMSCTFSNCLFERVYCDIEPADSATTVLRNDLFFGGNATLHPGGPNPPVVKDNLFDRSTNDFEGTFTADHKAPLG